MWCTEWGGESERTTARGDQRSGNVSNIWDDYEWGERGFVVCCTASFEIALPKECLSNLCLFATRRVRYLQQSLAIFSNLLIPISLLVKNVNRKWLVLAGDDDDYFTVVSYFLRAKPCQDLARTSRSCQPHDRTFLLSARTLPTVRI